MPGMATAVAARAGPLERPPIARRPAAPPILSLFQNCTAEESLTSPRNLFLKDTELVASSDDCCTDASPLSHSNTPHPKVGESTVTVLKAAALFLNLSVKQLQPRPAGLLFRRDPFRQANSRAHLSRSESALSAQSDSSVLRLPESPPLPSGSQSQGHRKRKAFKALRVEVDPSTSEAVQDAPSETLSHETVEAPVSSSFRIFFHASLQVAALFLWGDSRRELFRRHASRGSNHQSITILPPLHPRLQHLYQGHPVLLSGERLLKGWWNRHWPLYNTVARARAIRALGRSVPA